MARLSNIHQRYTADYCSKIRTLKHCLKTTLIFIPLCSWATSNLIFYEKIHKHYLIQVNDYLLIFIRIFKTQSGNLIHSRYSDTFETDC